MKKMHRREALRHLALSSITMSAASSFSLAENPDGNHKLKGNINHSVCQWTYNFLPLEELCQVVRKIGFNAIDLIAPKDWPTLQKYGIYSSMCYINGKVSLTEGFNDKKFHEQLVKE
jgi:hydroxypyruvate isomerase